VLRYVSSCDLCQRNVSKGTVGKAPLGSLPVIGTPFSVICIDLIGPLSPPSDGNRYQRGIGSPKGVCNRWQWAREGPGHVKSNYSAGELLMAPVSSES